MSSSHEEQIRTLREARLSYAEIGRRLGISRERVRQIHKGIMPMGKPKPQFELMLSSAEAARMLGVHPNTVRGWADKGILKSYRVGPRGDRRFRQSDIESFLSRSPDSSGEG
jgi:excisionase family DNA binding protein